MKIGILSDIHGNYEALCAVFEQIAKEKTACIYCLGDIVGYGPDPGLCIDLIFEKCEGIVLGNHDLACMDKVNINCFNEPARESILWTKRFIKKPCLDLLTNLPLTFFGHSMTFVHGSPAEPEKFIYINNEDDACFQFESLKTAICFTGHSHIPEAYIKNRDRLIKRSMENPLKIEFDSRYIINAGSVGQPRDGDNRACFGILDTEARIYTLHRTKYDFMKVQNKITNAGLPACLASRLPLGL